MYDEYGNPIVGGWNIYNQPNPNTGASFDDVLNSIYTQTAGIAVGAPLDPDLAAIQNLLSTSGAATGEWPMPMTGLDILTGAPVPQRPRVAPPQRPQAPNAAMMQLANLARSQAQELNRLKANQPPPGFGQRAVAINTEPNQTGFSPLPLSQTTPILAGGTATIIAEPQDPFKPQRLVVIGANWLLLDLKIGNRSVFSASGIIPGEVFAHDATGVNLNGDTADVGNKIFLTVTNNTGAPRSFYGTILGTFVRSR
jgi:hypothetical protein